MATEAVEAAKSVGVEFIGEQHRAPADLPIRITPVEPAAEVSPEIVAVITAAVLAYLDHESPARARIETRVTNAWLQYGRVLVQRSHNLPHRLARVA